MADAPLTLAQYRAQMVAIPGKDFRMGRTPVTVGMWQEFCQATKKPMPELPGDRVWKRGWAMVLDHPIVNVSWNDCAEYAQWSGLQLPSAAQWEFAARGGLTDKLYPWGDEEPNEQLWWILTSNLIGTASVQRTRNVFVNGYGLVDMVGNVWEWCGDWIEEDQSRILCGGSWIDGLYEERFRCADQFKVMLSDLDREIDLGFRLCSAP